MEWNERLQVMGQQATGNRQQATGYPLLHLCNPPDA